MGGFLYRLEEQKDYADVEALVREAFWNVYKPGCDEHFIVHALRGSDGVIEGLNYVCEDEAGEIVGQIFYTRSEVVDEAGTARPVATFGPIGVRPDVQRRGVGAALIRLSMQKAAEMGFGGVLITGDPNYYHRFGFRDASDFGITAEDGSSFPELMARELGAHGLDGVRGRLRFRPEFSNIDADALEAFDAQFPPKQKLKLPGQLC